MNIGLVIVGTLVILALGYRLHGGFVARVLGIDPRRPTPAVTINDGVDFVPTRTPVLFGHHFASIAAAGPIVGPTLAVIYGFMPAWLWIVFGVVFIGAVHDFTALFVSMRERGRSTAEVARATLGRSGFLFYLAFAVLLCILVCAAFLQLAAVALTSVVPLATVGLPATQTLLRTVTGGIPPVAGKVRLGSGVRLGYMSQEQEEFAPGENALTALQRVTGFAETGARTYLHKYLFSGDEVFTPVETLSFGQRARLSLACLVAQGCNLLLLDEPLNHLDLPSRDQFEKALAAFEGTLLVVTHDRYFIRRAATHLWEIRDGNLSTRETG